LGEAKTYVEELDQRGAKELGGSSKPEKEISGCPPRVPLKGGMKILMKRSPGFTLHLENFRKQGSHEKRWEVWARIKAEQFKATVVQLDRGVKSSLAQINGDGGIENENYLSSRDARHSGAPGEAVVASLRRRVTDWQPN